MQMVYEKLFSSEDFHKVSSLEYLGDLIDSIVLSSSVATRVKILRELEDLPLDADMLFPLGLILNEALTNVFKYAFPDHRPGCVTIRFAADGRGSCELVVVDDGIGLDSPSLVSCSQSSTSFGLTLIHALADQLAGKAELTSSISGTNGGATQTGTRVTIHFPYSLQISEVPSQEEACG
jgi:two-component sensor histidine kinase